MLPINGLQVFLLIANTPAWIKITAAMVVLWTLYGLAQGYARRLIVDRQGLRLRGLFQSIEIPWNAVARIGVYMPGGGLGATEYFYATTKSEPPQGKWDLDGDTIQIQDHPGLLEAVQAYQTKSLT